MRNLYIGIIIIILGSCQNKTIELNYFRGMTNYQKFDSVKDKAKILGFDLIVLEPTYLKENNNTCWYLSSPINAIFNIQGFIWKEDSIIYIKAINKDGVGFATAKKQVLFNFGKTNSSWTIDNKRGSILNDYTISSMKPFYIRTDLDTVVNFKVEKSRKKASHVSHSYTLQVSLKYGFYAVAYFNREDNSSYFIQLQPKQKLTIIKEKFKVAPLE